MLVAWWGVSSVDAGEGPGSGYILKVESKYLEDEMEREGKGLKPGQEGEWDLRFTDRKNWGSLVWEGGLRSCLWKMLGLRYLLDIKVERSSGRFI